MKIGIDARFWGLEHAGLGRYVIEFVSALTRIDRKNEYVLFVRKPYDKDFTFPKNFRLVRANIQHYTLEEQWLLAELFSRESLDLLHVPHFNVPLMYKSPFVVTIHDLLWHEVKGLNVTTQNPLMYLVKYVGYKLIVANALKKARKVFVPSKVIGDKLAQSHAVEAERVVVTYEAPSKKFSPKRKDGKILKEYAIKKPFIVYTGSAYPHKNIPAAAAGVKMINQRGKKVTLVVASARSVFLERLRRDLVKQGSAKHVRLLGFVPDEDLIKIYAHAKALIQPSKSEGFGLTGLEAMACNLPVIASRSAVFKEIYQGAALYVDPGSVQDIARKIETVLSDKQLAEKLRKSGRSRIRQFSWDALAKKTLRVYKEASSLRSR